MQCVKRKEDIAGSLYSLRFIHFHANFHFYRVCPCIVGSTQADVTGLWAFNASWSELANWSLEWFGVVTYFVSVHPQESHLSITDTNTVKQLVASSSLKNKRIYLDFRPGYKKLKDFESEILILGGVSVSQTSKVKSSNVFFGGDS